VVTITERSGYLPALRFRALTRVYDQLIRMPTRESHFKRLLLEQAGIAAGQRVLDLGCGTGTLVIQVKEWQPDAEVVGLDADPEMLAQARRKAERAGVELELTEGFSTALPYRDESFDVVLSTLFFHHLDPEPKRQTAREVFRVLRRGGELHVADLGRPQDPLMMVASVLSVRIFDGFSNTRDNVRGALPEIFAEFGLERAEETRRLRTGIGTLSLYRAARPKRLLPAA
jgi:ubiquinone/menaquinone biosynthesis C-methylase UbiE